MWIGVGEADEHLNISYWLWFKPGFDGFNTFLFNPFTLDRHGVAPIGIELHPYGIGTFLGWQKGRVSVEFRGPIEWLWCGPGLGLRYRRGCRPFTRWRRHQGFRLGYYSSSPGSWPERWKCRKAWPGIRSDHTGFWRPSSSHRLLVFASDGTPFVICSCVKRLAQPKQSSNSLIKGKGYQFLTVRLLSLR